MYKQLTDNYNGNIEYYSVRNYNHKLAWLTDLGIGHLSSDGYEYSEAYWEIYQKYAANDVGILLTNARADFVKKNIGTFESLCDVGIGSGQFVDTVKCKGTDVNEFANTWLKERGYYVKDVSEFTTLTLWDVIEHIENSTSLLASVTNVFISTPIYNSVEECLKSKHLKPGEHIWYFTDVGIKNFMSILGFDALDQSDFETALGRDRILSYYFKKKNE